MERPLYMENSDNLKWGVVLSYINTAASLLISVIYTPFLLRMLGQQQYGLYNMGQSAVSYLGLAGFGFNNAVVRYAAKYHAEGDEARAASLYGFFMYLFGILALLVFVLGLVITAFADRFYIVTTGAEGYRELRIIMLLLVINTSFQFATEVHSGIMRTYEQYAFMIIMDLIYTLSKPLFMIPLLLWGYRAIALSAMTTVCSMLLRVSYIVFIIKKLPVHIDMNPSHMDFSIMKELIGYSFFIFLGTLTSKLEGSTDTIILGGIAGEVAVAVYSAGLLLCAYAQQIPGTISGVFFPRVTGRIASGATMDEMTQFMMRVSRLQLYLALLVCSGFTLFGKDFIQLWLGEEYEAAYWIVLVMLLPAVAPNLQSVAVLIVQAMNRHQFSAVLYLMGAALNVITSIPAGMHYGPLGCAVCTGLTTIITSAIINWYYNKKIHLDIPAFWKNIGKLTFTILPTMFVGVALNYVFPSVTWRCLILKICIYTACYGCYAYLACMNQEEKGLVWEMLGKAGIGR